MKTLMLMLLFALPLQLTDDLTGSAGLTGNAWTKWTSLARLTYLLGVNDGSWAMSQHNVESYEKLRLRLRYFPRTHTDLGTFTDAIDQFFAEPANGPIGILGAMAIVAAKFDGATDNCVSAQTIVARLIAVNPNNLLAEARAREFQACGRHYL